MQLGAALVILGILAFFVVAGGGALLWGWLLSRIPSEDYTPYD
jgi:hypothetical protein